MRLGHLTRNFKDYLGVQTGKIKKNLIPGCSREMVLDFYLYHVAEQGYNEI